MYFWVSRLPGLSAMRISPSVLEMVEAVGEGEIDAAVGETDVIEDELDLVHRDDAANLLSTAAKYCSESSSRRPSGGLTWRRICRSRRRERSPADEEHDRKREGHEDAEEGEG